MDAIVGYAIALVLSMMGVAGFAAWAKIGVSNVKTAATASQLVIFDQAAQQYVRAHAAPLALQATQNVPVTLHASDLIDYLPAGFSGINPFGQTWQVQVLLLPGQQLQPLVTSQNGAPISDAKQLVQIAAQAGAEGGFVPYANQAGDAAMNPGDAMGAYGGWKLPLMNYTNPGSGHLASLLTVVNAPSLNNEYLYRVAIPGQPGVNQMETAIDMNGNDIDNAGNVGAQGVSVQSASGTSTVKIGAGSASYANATQQLTLAANGGAKIADATGAPAPLTAGDISAGNINGSYLLASGAAIAGAPCNTAGQIANSGSGPLFCQAGVWSIEGSAVGFGGDFTYYSAYGECATANIATGYCSCPSGYTAFAQVAFGVSSESPGGAVLYACERYPN
ncbi:MAG: shufflon system plasmid conjugative transfer pilus tip adhesin PilV [Trinickia sp.]|uniref:shufflon system plasmid conjugative transfer pilus tip adhesin PilV n=1 Tax=Trinickia sp. TaxID=2571163 RepID=UPI003F7D1AAC